MAAPVTGPEIQQFHEFQDQIMFIRLPDNAISMVSKRVRLASPGGIVLDKPQVEDLPNEVGINVVCQFMAAYVQAQADTLRVLQNSPQMLRLEGSS